MKKITISIILISLLITSCNAQTKIDLLDINLPVKSGLFLTDNYKMEQFWLTEPGYTLYRSYDPHLLIFNGEIIASDIIDGPDHNTNNGLFYLNNETKMFSAIEMSSFETKKSQLIHEVLLKKFGEPNYFKSVSFASYSVWENKLTNNIYLFEHNYGSKSNGIPVESGKLYIIDLNDEALINKFSKATYSYYIEYLKQRIKDGRDYSYEEFAKKEDEEGTSRYLKAISNPVKH